MFAKIYFLKARVAPEHDERPDRGYCQKVPQSVCAVAYDRWSKLVAFIDKGKAL